MLRLVSNFVIVDVVERDMNICGGGDFTRDAGLINGRCFLTDGLESVDRVKSLSTAPHYYGSRAAKHSVIKRVVGIRGAYDYQPHPPKGGAALFNICGGGGELGLKYREPLPAALNNQGVNSQSLISHQKYGRGYLLAPVRESKGDSLVAPGPFYYE